MTPKHQTGLLFVYCTTNLICWNI